MNISEQTVDQWVNQCVIDEKRFLEDDLGIKNAPEKAKSACFTLLCAEAVLGLDREQARTAMVEGGGDFGVDAIHVSDVTESDFKVTLFQAKYHVKLDGSKGFAMSGVEKVIAALSTFFDPSVQVTFNERLTERVAEIRSLVGDGLIPNIRIVLCSNGKTWEGNAAELISNNQSSQVTWDDHFNAERLIALRTSSSPISAKLRFTGASLVEGYDYRRVAIGKIRVSELAALFERNGDSLLEKNIRRYLGQSGRINHGIQETLKTETDRPNFYFFNNGITIVCTKFSYNAQQKEDHIFQVEGLQVINGGQTCKTIQEVLKTIDPAAPGLDQAYVLVRLYELQGEDGDLIRSITYATNSQNPVDLRDLKSNDPIQRALEISIAGLNHNYIRYKSDSSSTDRDISSAIAAQAVLSVWRGRPQMAKYQGGEHFGRLYDLIFTPDLNGAQVVLAVDLVRFAERKRRAAAAGSPLFIPYATQVMAMLLGEELLKNAGVTLATLNHTNLATVQAYFATHSETLYTTVTNRVAVGLKRHLGVADLSECTWQRIAGAFRRGDLLNELRSV